MNWRRCAGIDLRAFHVDDAAAAAALEQRFEQQHQIFGFFLDFDVAVAQDAEHAPARHVVAGEELVEIKRDDMFQRNEAGDLAVVSGSRMKRCSCGGTGIRAENSLLSRAVGQRQGDGEAEIGNEGKGMRRIDGERRQNRKNLLAELGVEQGAVAVVQFLAGDDSDAFLAQLLVAASPRCIADRRSAGARGLVDLGELLGGRQAVGGRRGDAGRAPCPSGRPRAPCRIRRGWTRRSTESAAARTSGWRRFCASSITRRLKASQDSSRLTKRAGEAGSSARLLP